MNEPAWVERARDPCCGIKLALFSGYEKKRICHIHNEYRSAYISAEAPLVSAFPKWYGNFRVGEVTVSFLDLLQLVMRASFQLQMTGN